MSKLPITDQVTHRAILNYIESLIPGVHVVVMMYDHEAKISVPTTNADPEAAIVLVRHLLGHMENTEPRLDRRPQKQ